MSTVTSKLIVSLVDRLSAPARGLTGTIDRMTQASRNNAARLSAMRGRMLEAAGAGYALYQGLAAPLNAAMDFESAMADVRKVVDFETPEAFKQMGLDIREMSRNLPMAADQIAAIVAAAGQSGIANSELLAFTEIAAKVGVAWDMAAGQTGEALAKLKTALGRSVADTASLADAINHLGNNSAAAAPDILNVVSRVAPMASQFGLTAEEVAAMGAAMVGSGFGAEVASTSLLNMGRALTKGAGATARQREAFELLGLSSAQVAKDMQVNAVGTIQNVLERLREVPDHLRAAAISDIFGDEARALGPLIENSQLLAEVMAMVADRTAYAGSAQAEYNERAKTTANALQLFRNRVNDLAIAVGNALVPGLNRILDVLGPVVTSIADLAQRYPVLTQAIVATTASIVAFRVAAIGAQFAGLFMKGALLDIGIAALSAARGLGRIAFAPVIGGFNRLRAAMVSYAATAAIIGHGGAMKTVGASLLGLLNPLKLVTGAFRALRLAVIGTGVGAILVGIAAAGTWIYNNWSGISRMFTAFGSAFLEAIAPVRPALDPVIDGISGLVTWVGNLLGPVDGLGATWFAMGRAAGTAVGDIVVAIVELPGKIAAFAGEMLEAGKKLGRAIYDGVVEVIAELVSYIKSAISNAISSAGSAARNLASRLTFGLVGGDDGVDGARASGGPVRAGGTYLVGERGPELFSPGRSGIISPHEAYAAAKAGSSTTTNRNRTMAPVINNNITINGATMSLQQLASEVERRISDGVRRTVEGAFGDGVYA